MGEAGGPRRYQVGGLRLSIGAQHTVELPVHAYRGRLTGMFFDTAKCCLLPSAMLGIQGLIDYFLDHPGATVLVVGHTDTRGDATYNLPLTPRGEQHIGGPCDPFALRDALRRAAWDEVDRLLGATPPPSPATDDVQPEFIDDHL